MFFFFQQKTAYELLISDWSSDVCSSDLRSRTFAGAVPTQPAEGGGAVALSAAWRGTVGCHSSIGCSRDCCRGPHRLVRPAATGPRQARRSDKIVRPYCRERVCQYVSILVAAVPVKKKTDNTTRSK